MVEYGLYLPDYFKHQQYDNFYDVPFEQLNGDYFVHIDYFRKIYKENKRIFNQLSKELVFRGGEFILEKESPLFPKIELNNNTLITINSDISEDAYKRIDYDVYGIQQFIKMFNISNNTFFDYVPLEGFKVLNLSNQSILYLKKKFEQSGFTLSQYDSIANKRIKQNRANRTLIGSTNVSEKFHNNFKVIENNNEDQDESERIERPSNIMTPMETKSKYFSHELSDIERSRIVVKIGSSNFKRLSSFLSGNKKNPFLKYLLIKELNFHKGINEVFESFDINNISQLNEDIMLRILDTTTSSDVNNIIKVLDTFLLNPNLIAKKIIDYVNENPHLKEYTVDSLLKENSYNKFKKNAHHLELRKLKDFTHSKTIQLLRSEMVGKTKIYNFLNILFSLNPNATTTKLLNNNNISSLSQEEIPVYFAYGFVENSDIRKYIKKRELSFLSESEIIEIIKYKAKKNKDKKTLISSIEKSIENFKNVTKENLAFTSDYRLTIDEILEIFDIEYISDQLKEQNLLAKPIHQIADNFDDFSSNLKQIILLYQNSIKVINDLKNSPSELFGFDEREKIIFDLRIKSNSKETLDSLATKIGGVTRERVRQIEFKVKSKIKNILSSDRISLYLAHLEKNNIYTVQDEQIINILKSIKINEVYYNEFFEISVHNKYREFLEIIEINLYELTKTKDIFLIEELINYLNEQKSSYNNQIINLIESDIEGYLSKLEFKIKKGTVIKERLSKVKLYTFIIEKYYSIESVDFSDEVSFNLFLDRLQEFAPEEMLNDLRSRDRNDLIRSIETILDRNNEKVLKLNAHEYKLLNVNTLPYDLIDDMYQFVKDELAENGFIAIKKVYRQFEKMIIIAGFTEKTVYNVLKLLFEEEFDFAGKTTLRIYGKGAERKTTKEIIISLLEKHNGKLSIIDITNEMGVEEYTLHQHLDNDYYILNGIVYLNDSEINLSSETTDTIKKIFNNIINTKNYVPVKQIFDEIRFIGDINSDLSDNNFDSLDRFARLLKQLFPEIEGHTRILYKKGSRINTMEVLLSEINFLDEIYRDDLFKVGDELGFAEVTINMYLNNYIECGDIVPLNNDKFITSDFLKIEEHLLSSIEIYLKDFFSENEYLSLSSINQELYKLPKIGDYKWSTELLNYIAIHCLFYKKIVVHESHYNNDPLIIKLADSNLTYRDIIAIEMQDFDNIRTENNVLRFLIDRGLLRGNARSIYKWFFNKKIFIKNDFERIYLAEEVLVHE